ncbi:MAG: hypothetical protein V7603_6812 [Micromonosporaceae bacterium]
MTEPTEPGDTELDDTLDDGDFAEEHTKPTYADEVPDGPEHARDPDSPRGLAGADPDET